MHLKQQSARGSEIQTLTFLNCKLERYVIDGTSSYKNMTGLSNSFAAAIQAHNFTSRFPSRIIKMFAWKINK